MGAEATGGRSPSSLAGLVSQSALSLAPEPVLSTSDGDASALDAPNPEIPGFISTGAIAEADPSLLPWDEPQRYVVQEGDTVTAIASNFGREPETLLYANPTIRENPHNLSIGDEITILPVDGVLHIVEDGDTVASIAEKYHATPDQVMSYPANGLQAVDSALVAGAEVVVPGGRMDITIPPLIQVSRGPAGGSSWAPSPSFGGPLVGTGTFHIAAYGRITTWFSGWHPGIDIANSYGTAIYAIDSGTVEVAGWYGWAGNAVVVDHGNGYESLYAHMQSVNVGVGQSIQRGQILGTIGCSRGAGGRCTGPHLHLETYYNGGRVNPCALGVCP
jgi:murein DD-endopeptidase MepM/ murein hydrolase activator NlpD